MQDQMKQSYQKPKLRTNASLPREKTPSWYKAITVDTLSEITRGIVAACNPEKVVLFGSYAYGKPDLHSDVDVLVITNRYREKSVFQRAYLVARVARPPRIALDILVRTPQEVASRLKMGDPFFREIMTNGKVLYERSHARGRMGQKSGR